MVNLLDKLMKLYQILKILKCNDFPKSKRHKAAFSGGNKYWAKQYTKRYNMLGIQAWKQNC